MKSAVYTVPAVPRIEPIASEERSRIRLSGRKTCGRGRGESGRERAVYEARRRGGVCVKRGGAHQQRDQADDLIRAGEHRWRADQLADRRKRLANDDGVGERTRKRLEDDCERRQDRALLAHHLGPHVLVRVCADGVADARNQRKAVAREAAQQHEESQRWHQRHGSAAEAAHARSEREDTGANDVLCEVHGRCEDRRAGGLLSHLGRRCGHESRAGRRTPKRWPDRNATGVRHAASIDREGVCWQRKHA